MSYSKQFRKDSLTSNHEGAVAWRMTPEWELYTTVVTTMGTEDKFYEKGDDRVRRIAELVRKVEPEYVAQLAIYSREEMHLRSVPMLLLVELARCHHGDSLVSRAVSRTLQRADEITELLMCYQWRMRRKSLCQMSHQLRKGLAEAFNRFDEYQFAKYNRTDRKVTLRDALLLVHPKPKNKAQAEIFSKILNGTLATPYTWETELSAVGQRYFTSTEEMMEAKREAWLQLVKSHRMGYMATLRNLRNMLQLRLDDESMRTVCDSLADAEAVRKSKQLPFRFLSAYLELCEINTDIIFGFQHTLGPTLSQVESRIAILERVLKEWRAGNYVVPVRKTTRYSSINATSPWSIVNRVVVPKDWEIHSPKMHCRRRVLVQKHIDNPPKQYVLKQQRIEKLLYGLKKREATLHKSIKKSDMVRISRRFGENSVHVLQALESAVCHTADNICGFDENTRVLLASDVSGSMCRPVSEQSSVLIYHIGLLLSMLMKHRCENVVAGIFGTDWKVCDFSSNDILRNTVDMVSREGEVGYSTNGYKVIDWLIDENRVMDKVMLFTDCELWNSDRYYGDAHLSKSWNRYKNIAPEAKLYIFNLAGYGTSPIDMKSDDLFCIAGWSDKVFDILAALEQGGNAINVIRQIAV